MIQASAPRFAGAVFASSSFLDGALGVDPSFLQGFDAAGGGAKPAHRPAGPLDVLLFIAPTSEVLAVPARPSMALAQYGVVNVRTAASIWSGSSPLC